MSRELYPDKFKDSSGIGTFVRSTAEALAMLWGGVWRVLPL
jgi:hypothetical protein